MFVIATANNVQALPPELLRKGRFDEIFFVDLPSAKEREEIFKIHINKKKRDVETIDINTLVSASQQFVGEATIFIAEDLQVDGGDDTADSQSK